MKYLISEESKNQIRMNQRPKVCPVSDLVQLV